MTYRCNAYGAENPDGIAHPLGGLVTNDVAVQPVCENQATHRFRWVCEHDHRGPIVSLCERHYAEFQGLSSYRDEDGREQYMPWNIRRNVQVCPRCASMAPEPELQHKCSVRLVTVS
jgi:hypothetical protein